MKSELKELIYVDYLNDFTEKEIAERHKISQPKVSRTLKYFKTTLEHRLSKLAIIEFEEYFFKLKDAIEKDVKKITEDMEKEQDPERIDRLMQMRHQRRLDLWKLLGDGEMVLVTKKMKNGASQNLT